MKRSLFKAAVIWGSSLLFIIVTASFSFSGGVITYKLKIKNDTPDAKCFVDVYASNGWLGRISHMPAGSTQTFETGGMNCFTAVSGSCYVYQVSSDVIKTKCLLGNREVSDASSCAAYCVNADWFIRRDSNGVYHLHRE